MRLLKTIVLLFIAIALVQCQKEVSYNFGNDPKPATPAPIDATIQGNIFDENGQPAAGVSVKVGTESVITDNKGYFRVNDAALDKNASLVTAEKPGYFKAYRTFPATSGVNNIHIKLIRKEISGTVDAIAGGEVSLTNGMKVSLPANGIVKASDGTTYTGTVNVYASYIDPTSVDIDQVVPGSFIADDENGGRVVMASFGMMAVDLESTSGEKLQIKSGSKATLTSPIPASLQSSAPATIDLWYVDEATGIWKEQGTAQKNANNYVGEVSHFSFWNCDVGLPTVNITMTIKNDQGLPVVHAFVKLSASNPFPSFAYGFTDSLGQVSGMVPTNQPLVLEVLDQCYNPIYSQNIGPFSQNANVGDVVIPQANTSLYLVTGTILNCAGSPVTNGYVILYHQYVTRYAAVNANGEFSISFIRCNTSPNEFQVIAVDESGQQQGNIVNTTFTGQQTNIGNLMACGTSIDQYISITINGTLHEVSYPADSMAAFTYPDSLGGFETNLNGNFIQNGTTVRYVGFNFRHNAESPGLYPVTAFLTAEHHSFVTVISPFNVDLTSYASFPGGYYEGSLSGSFIFQGNTYNASGTFRVRRSW